MKKPRMKYKVGQKYNMLTIIELWTERASPNRDFESKCKCLCDCGNEVIAWGKYIGHGEKQSCGCKPKLRNEEHHSWKGHGEISGNRWNQIKRSSQERIRNIIFNITIEFAWELFLKQNRKCSISGVEIFFAKTYKDEATGTASLDRIDSSKDYTEDNVQWVHKDINLMKWSLPQEDLIKLCLAVAEYNQV
jgi:hypothetical protein